MPEILDLYSEAQRRAFINVDTHGKPYTFDDKKLSMDLIDLKFRSVNPLMSPVVIAAADFKNGTTVQ
jgi:hypothetical protein